PHVSIAFYRAVHHSDLHSFPTRRSSDLVWRIMGRLCRLAVQSAHEKSLLLLGLISDKFAQRMHASAKLAERERFELAVWFSDLLDRKSTRLNSSHVSISYAVFCLKKKNK